MTNPILAGAEPWSHTGSGQDGAVVVHGFTAEGFLYAQTLNRLVRKGFKVIAIDMAGVQELDTLGAWLLERLLRNSNLSEPEAQFIGLPPHYRGLIDAIHRVDLQKRMRDRRPEDFVRKAGIRKAGVDNAGVRRAG